MTFGLSVKFSTFTSEIYCLLSFSSIFQLLLLHLGMSTRLWRDSCRWASCRSVNQCDGVYNIKKLILLELGYLVAEERKSE